MKISRKIKINQKNTDLNNIRTDNITSKNEAIECKTV